MRKQKTYNRTRFSADVLAESWNSLRSLLPADRDCESAWLKVDVHDATWDHDTETSFLTDYRQATGDASFMLSSSGQPRYSMWGSVSGQKHYEWTKVEVQAPSRSEIDTVFEVFEKHADASTLPDDQFPANAKIFIGHGGSQLWRDLKDHLQDQQGYDVVAYEIGARAGHEVRDVLQEMLNQSSLAFLVTVTGEDETADVTYQGSSKRSP